MDAKGILLQVTRQCVNYLLPLPLHFDLLAITQGSNVL